MSNPDDLLERWKQQRREARPGQAFTDATMRRLREAASQPQARPRFAWFASPLANAAIITLAYVFGIAKVLAIFVVTLTL